MYYRNTGTGPLLWAPSLEGRLNSLDSNQMVSTVAEFLSGSVVWYLGTLLLGLPALGLFCRFFPAPYGWMFGRLLGPVLLSWLCILPAAVLPSAAFTPLALCVGALLLGGVSFVWGKRPQFDKELVWFEGFFLSLSLFFSGLLPWVITLYGNDEIVDSAYFNSLYFQRVFPMQDPELAFHTLYYYVFGFYPKVAAAFLMPWHPMRSLQLATASVVAAYMAGLYVFLRSLGLTLRWATICALVLGFCANFQSVLDILRKLTTGQPYVDTAMGWLDDDFATGGTINSVFLAGGLHTTVLSFSLLPVFFATVCLFLKSKRASDQQAWAFGLLTAVMAAWAKGANTWEVPLYLGFLLTAFLLMAQQRSMRKTAAFVVGSIVLYVAAGLPFNKLVRAAPLVFSLVERGTPIAVLLRHWAIVFLPFALWFGGSLRHSPKSAGLWAVVAAWALGIWLNESILFLAGFAWFCAYQAWVSKPGRVLFYLSFVGFAVLLVPEIVYLRNTTALRFNTLTHLNVLSWCLLGGCGAAVLLDVLRKPPRPLKIALLCLFAVLLFPYSFLAGVKNRVKDADLFDDKNGLRVIAQFDPSHAALIEAIQKEQLKTPLNGVLVEAIGEEYDATMSSRTTAATGLRSYLGFYRHAGHENFHSSHPDIEHRKNFMRSLAEGKQEAIGKPCEDFVAVLKAERIDYVTVSAQERKYFHSSFLKKVDGCLTIRLAAGASRLYEVL